MQALAAPLSRSIPSAVIVFGAPSFHCLAASSRCSYLTRTGSTLGVVHPSPAWIGLPASFFGRRTLGAPDLFFCPYPGWISSRSCPPMRLALARAVATVVTPVQARQLPPP